MANVRSDEQRIDPEIERIMQDMKRLKNGIVAVEDRLLQYLARQAR